MSSEIFCEVDFGVLLPVCPVCLWAPGVYSDGRVYCNCGDYAKTEYVDRVNRIVEEKLTNENP